MLLTEQLSSPTCMYVRIDNRFTVIFIFNNDLFGEQGVKVKSYVTSILQWSSVE